MAEYAHNMWPSETTKKSLFDLIIGYTLTIEVVKKPGMVPSVEECMKELDKIRQEALVNIIKAQKMMEVGNLGNRKFQLYQKNDQVWVEGTNIKTIYLSAKLGLKQHGPFKVLEQLSEAIHQVEIPQQWKIHKVFHVVKARLAFCQSTSWQGIP